MSRIKNFDQVIEQLKPKLIDYLEEKGINTKTNFICIHPDHNEDVASCGIVRQSGFTKWHCFSCHAFGDIFDACAYLEKKPNSGPDYLKENVLYLANKYGIEVQEQEPTEEEKHRIEIFNAYKQAAFYIANHPTEKAIAEMNRRGWLPEECKVRFIGSVDSFENYKNHMKAQGYSVSFLDSIDLLRPQLFTESNLLFTVCDEFGRPCGFGARNLDYDPENKESKKYVNSKNFGTDVKCQIYEKSKRLYNFHNAKKTMGSIYIMEGYGDVETAIQAGLPNVVCVGGTSFTEYHIIELSKAGKTDVTICMDGDDKGIESIDRMLEKFTNYREFSVHVVVPGEGLDPDDYIRKYGLEKFLKLKRFTAFEWKLSNYDDRIDTQLIRKEVIPIIASESSPIAREEMARILSTRINISEKAIVEEIEQLLNEAEARKAQEQQGVISSLITDLKLCPTDWRLAISKAQTNLDALSQNYNQESFSTAAYLKDLELIEVEEREYNPDRSSVIELAHWREFSDAIRGDWDATLNVIGGRANSGKTALMACLALQIAEAENDNVMVLFHTIDDTVKQFTTRLVAQYAQEQMSSITLNMIKNPNGYSNQKVINKAREYGYGKIRELVSRQKLLVRGGEQRGGATLSFAQDMIKYYKKTFPDKKIIYFLDNFHRLRDFSHLSDERIRFKNLSQATKDIAKQENIAIFATMEYNKAAAGNRPDNNSISESIAMEYDANLIAHVYNELHDKRENAETFFTRTDSNGNAYKAPRIELIFGKNKLNEFKGSLFFDFYSEQSRFVPVAASLVREEIERQRKMKEESNRVQGRKSYGTNYPAGH